MASTETVSKFVRDPVHDIIRARHRFILDLLNTRAMQRLHRIRQLGLAWLVYPGAEHSRFTHSLGAYHLASRVMNQLEEEQHAANPAGRSELFNEEQREAVLAAALLHDIGHGPFSHAFEHAIGHVSGRHVGHETWTKQIIRDDEGIQGALANASSDHITEDIVEIINGTASPQYLAALVSSQLDVDRFDYLLRDSHMTGCQYGTFDLEWMLRTLAVRAVRQGSSSAQTIETIVVDGRRGLDGLEAHLVGRHYMYRHVYLHKTIRSAEFVLRGIFQRAALLIRQGSLLNFSDTFTKLVSDQAVPVTVAEYLALDDFVIFSWIEAWAHTAADSILRDLSERLINRRLLKTIVVPAATSTTRARYSDNREAVRHVVEQHGHDPAYYFLEDSVQDIAYKDFLYNVQKGKENLFEAEIWYFDQGDGRTHPLSSYEMGVIVQARHALEFHNDYWFVPEDVAGDPTVKGLLWT